MSSERAGNEEMPPEQFDAFVENLIDNLGRADRFELGFSALIARAVKTFDSVQLSERQWTELTAGLAWTCLESIDTLTRNLHESGDQEEYYQRVSSILTVADQILSGGDRVRQLREAYDG